MTIGNTEIVGDKKSVCPRGGFVIVIDECVCNEWI
jgi:hypothetical protein